VNYTFWLDPLPFDWVLVALPFLLMGYFIYDICKSKKEKEKTMMKKLEVAANNWIADPSAENEKALDDILCEIDGVYNG
jgi:hypothetical protein